jgi:hypothetical protein
MHARMVPYGRRMRRDLKYLLLEIRVESRSKSESSLIVDYDERREMSQQAAAGRGAGRGSGKKPRYFPRKGGGNFTATAKAYKSPITKIAKYTFNTGENKFAAQFTKS